MEIILPKIALTMTSGVIVEWYKSPGDHVRKGEPILAFETDKTAIDLEADTDGVLREVRAQVGDEVVAGSVIGILEVDGSTDMPAVPPPARSQEQQEVAPAARDLAAALGVDLSGVLGSGTAGRIIEQDVIAAAARKSETTAASPPEDGDAVEARVSVTPLDFSARRLASWATLDWAAAVPTFHLATRIDLSAHAREMKAASVSPVDVLAVAAARALRSHPTCNGRFQDGRAETYSGVRIGILYRNGDSLLPLVFDDPAEETASEFRTRRRIAQDAAAGGRIAAANSGDPTFVISNLGAFAVEWFTAMLYPGTSVTAALGTSGAGVLEESEAAVVLTCDHRVVDGVDAAQFARSLQEAVLTVSIAGEERR